MLPFTWFLNLSPTYKILGLAGLFLIGFFSGIYYQGLVYKARQVEEYEQIIQGRDKQILGLQEEVKMQSDIAKILVAEKATWVEKNNKRSEKIEASYAKTPAITTNCVAPIRVQLLNEQREAANLIGSAR